MKCTTRALLCLALALGAITALAVPASAQTVTTGTLSGTVVDEQGGVLPGASIIATHGPTGTSYEAVVGPDGRFVISGVQVGGPYKVTAKMQGFKDQDLSNLVVALGEDRAVNFKLQIATLQEAVTVTATSPLLDTSRAGTASNVPSEAIDNLPTIQRSLFDFARVSPFFTPIALNNDVNSLSVAGQNNRYNNVQIDGAVNNDLFGIAVSGTPGGQADTEPVSLDAIQELQLVVSPYDVRQGMFAGGGINAITKSGTNAIRGTGYYFGRNQKLVGENPEGIPIADFSSMQFGGSLGGPIVANKAFYFGNLDFGRKDTPSGFSIGGTGVNFGLDAEAARFLNIVRNRYGYDPGDPTEFIRTTDNDKVFMRGDFNLRPGQRLTARHNYINAVNDVGRPDTTRFIFADNFYRFASKTNSTVAQLNSAFGTSANELRFTYQRVRERRLPSPGFDEPFPQIDVRVGGGSRFFRAGREQFSGNNELDQDIIEITDDFTRVLGSHTLVVGTHNEFFKFRNLFIRDSFGTYTFSNLDLFEQGIAVAYDYSFSVTGEPKQASRFQVRQFGFYAGDQWRPMDRMTVTFGARLDLPRFPDKPTANPDALSFYGFSTDVVPNQTLFSPRVGVTYDVDGNGRQIVRGGVGSFSGRTPYVWLSNQYGNTGNEFQRIRVAESSTNPARIPFVADPNNQPRTITGVGASQNEIDVIDPDYKFPQLIRGNVGYDRTLFFGLTGTAELLFSRTIRDIRYENVNLVQTGTRPDGRPVFGRRNTTYGDVILLANTDQGDSWSVSVKLERPWRNGWYASGSYLYGVAHSIMDGTSSQAASNWGNVYVPGDPNNAPLARSNFSPGNRVNLAFSRQFDIGGGARAVASIYYSGQSGRPYSLNFSSDANADGRFSNDLLYLPRDANDVILRSSSTAPADQARIDRYFAFLNSEECYAKFLGRIHERNACRAPWINTFDFRVAVNVPTGNRAKVELTFDLLNLINRFDSQNGLLRYADFNDILVNTFGGVDAATGKAIYNIATVTNVDANGNPTFQKFRRDDLKSRWQGQFGLRVRF